MKEIDFLPEWYKSGRRRQLSYRTQYIALVGIFVVMMVWNFIASRSVSKRQAELAQSQSNQAQVQSVSLEFDRIKNEVRELQKKADTLEQIDSRIDVANVLAEMSFLMDKKIVLSKVELHAENFVDGHKGKMKTRSGVRAARTNLGRSGKPLLGDVIFKVVINGVAADSSNVAELVCKLEDSPYFRQVTSSWQNREIKAGTSSAGENYQASEFEISCYLANYQQQELYFAKEAQSSKAER